MTACPVVQGTVGGLRVIAAHLPRAHSCVGALDVHTGFADDPPGQAGTAHLTEHICVALAARRHRVQMAAATHAAATRFSARATATGAVDLINAITSVFDAGLADRATHDGETQAVLTENLRLHDQPQLDLAVAVAARYRPDLDLANRDLTTPESLATVTPSDISMFRHCHYRPDRAVLCLVGPEDPDQLLDRVEAAGVLAEMTPPPAPLESTNSPESMTSPPRSKGTEPPRRASWPDRFMWATLTPVAAADDLLARALAIELLVGPSGILGRVASQADTRALGSAALTGRDREMHVIAFPADAEDALIPACSGAEVLHLVAAGVSAAWQRWRSKTAFDLQSPGTLASHLLRYALGNGPWPELSDDTAAAASPRVVSLAVAMMNNAIMCRTREGHLQDAGVRP